MTHNQPADLICLADQWTKLWCRIRGTGDPLQLFCSIVDAYAEPPRAYHSLRHIETCLSEFRQSCQLCENPDEVEIALWFHDAVYNPRANDNEERSAEFATTTLRESGLLNDFIRRTHDLILATKHAAVPIERDASVLVDIDLSIIGKPVKEFDDYERMIREEYEWVPDEAFKAGRAKILRQFVKRPYIYSMEIFRSKYEVQARINLERSIRRLTKA